MRAICACGKVDYGSIEDIFPLMPGVKVIGASSDHTLLDVEELFAGLRRELDFAEERFRTKDEARRFHLMEEYHGDQV